MLLTDPRRVLKSALLAAIVCAAPLCLFSGCGKSASDDVTVTMKSEDGTEEAPEVAGSETPSEAAPAADAAPAAAGGIGDVVGTVVFDGTPPQLDAIIAQGADVRDKEVCSAEAIPNEELIVNAENKGVQNVFVYLEKPPSGANAEPATDNAIFDQKGCRFLPHAMIVRTKQTILVLSDDPIAHNTHTFPKRNKVFNTAIKVNERDGVPLTYDRPEQVPVEVKCDFHPWMKAWHLPLDHGFAALTDENGKFEIKGLPAGTHSFRIWHEKGGILDRGFKITVKPGDPEPVTIKFAADKFASFGGPAPRQTVVSTLP